MISFSSGILLIIFLALLEVQTISLKVFISAEQLIYETTTAFGYLALNIAKSFGGHDSANEHPAFKSGRSTFFFGFIIFAVSAMK